MDFKIEKGVPMPEPGVSPGRPRKYNWPAMEVGDSVFSAGDFARIDECNAYSAARVWGTRNGRKFAGRTVEGGVRIWRVK